MLLGCLDQKVQSNLSFPIPIESAFYGNRKCLAVVTARQAGQGGGVKDWD